MDHVVQPEFQEMMQALDLLPGLVWLLPAGSSDIKWNARGRDRLRLPTPAPATDGFFLAPYLAPGDSAAAEQSWSTTAANSGLWEMELRLHAADGSPCWHLLRAERRPDGSWLGTATDIHALKLRELDAAEHERHYKSLMENSSQSIWRFAMDVPLDRSWSVEQQIAHLYKHGYVAECNLAMARTYGFTSPEEMRGARLEDLMPSSEPANIAFLTHAIESGYRVTDVESVEVDRQGQPLHLLNSFIAEEDAIFSAWGTSLDITPRVLVEQALRQSEERFHRAAEMGRVGIWELDLSTRTFYISPQLHAMLGYAHGEIDDRLDTWRRLVHPDDLARVRQAVLEHIEGRTPVYEAETRRRHKEGHYLWFLSRGTVIRDESGSPLKISGADTDITLQKATQEELRASEDRYRRAAEMGRVGIWEFDLATKHFFIAPHLKAMLGYGDHEVENHLHAWCLHVHPDDLPRLERAVQEHLSGGTPVYESEVRRRHKDGHYLWFLSRGTAVHDAEGVPFKMIGADTDITERKAVQEALRESEKRLSLIFHNSTDCLYLVEAHPERGYVMVSANETFLRKAGLAGRNVHGLLLHDILPAEIGELAKQKLDETVLKKSPVMYEQILMLPDRRIFSEVTLIPIIEADGRLTHLLATITDRSAYKDAEEALQQARDAAEAASKSKDRFLAVLSHELRTPLTPVLLNVSAMEEDPLMPEPFRDVLSMVRRNVELETKLIDDLLDLSRITSGKLNLQVQPLDMNDTLRHVLETCSSQLVEGEVCLHLDLYDGPLIVSGDQARLQQVLWNVLKNAVKFTPEGGSILIKSSIRPASPPLVRVEIKDTGIGIEEEQIHRIFEAFHQGDGRITTEFGGLGLGLAISKAVIELHQGRIWAESLGYGHGATFILELPFCTAPCRVAPPRPQTSPIPPVKSRLLLVEDHFDTANTLARLLRNRGYTITIASTVAEALDVARGGSFDLIVSDIGLPDASGYDLMRQLRETSTIKGIAMSGYGMEEDIQKGRVAGFSEHLVKPIKISSLIEAIERVTGG